MYALGGGRNGLYKVINVKPYILWFFQGRVPLLDKAEIENMFCYDPIQPTKGKVEEYCICGARRRTHFLKTSLGLELRLRPLTLPFLPILNGLARFQQIIASEARKILYGLASGLCFMQSTIR
jgi:hypothetical protein